MNIFMARMTRRLPRERERFSRIRYSQINRYGVRSSVYLIYDKANQRRNDVKEHLAPRALEIRLDNSQRRNLPSGVSRKRPRLI